jgi:HPt (histidine-containing phosphotransfer) domain-containing protein
MNELLKKLAGFLEIRTVAHEPGTSAVVNDPKASKDIVFDPTYLADVAAALSAERLTALVYSYFDHTNGQLEKIETLLVSNDVEAIMPEAHALVGSAGSFGAVHFSVIARKLEQTIKNQQFDALPLLVADLRKASDRASAALAEWLKARPTPAVTE